MIGTPVRAAFAIALCCATSAAVHAASDPIAEATAVVARFHAAMAASDADAALGCLAPQVVIFESGGAELSREEYAHHHLKGDLEFVAATRSERSDRRAGASGDLVWVLTRSRTSGAFRGRDIRSESTETMLLERADGGWRIVHVHWSSRKSD